MFNLLIFITSLVCFPVGIYTSLTMEQLYHKYNKIELRYLAIGFLLYLLIPISYMVLALDFTENTAEVATAIHQFLAIIAFGIGFSLTLIGFRGLIESPFPRRYWIYLFCDLFVLPYAFLTGFRFAFMENKWTAVYNPHFFVYIVGSPAIYVGLEIAISTYILIKDTPYKQVKQLFVAMTVSFLLTFPIFILRDVLSLPLNFFIIPMLFYLLFLALLIRAQPEIFLTTTTDPQFLLVVEKNTGIPLKLYHFVDNEYLHSDEALMAGALTAIQSVLKELSTNEEEISYIGFPNTHIILESTDQWQFILGSKTRSRALESLLKIIKSEFSALDIEVGAGSITERSEQKINEIINHVFIHQLNRLDLILKEMNQ